MGGGLQPQIGLNTGRATCIERLECGLLSGVLKPSQTDHDSLN